MSLALLLACSACATWAHRDPTVAAASPGTATAPATGTAKVPATASAATSAAANPSPAAQSPVPVDAAATHAPSPPSTASSDAASTAATPRSKKPAGTPKASKPRPAASNPAGSANPRPTTQPTAAPAAPAAASHPAAAAPPAASKPAVDTLDLAALEQRLKDTKAIGVFTKLSLKNQVDDLLGEFRAFHRTAAKTPPDKLRREYDGLMLKVLSLLQDSDPQLAAAISSSREAIWGVLTDPEKFAKI